MTRTIDAHHHLWNLQRVDYPWLVPEYGPLYRTYEPQELEPQLQAAGIDATVLVQAADSYADTESMLAHAEDFAWIAGVVGWVPLHRPDEAAAALDRFRRHPRFVGVRHLIHEETDPDWVLQDTVIDSLRLLAEHDLTFDVVAVLPRHLEHVPVLVERVPGLRMVIDHLGKPPIKDKGWSPWAELLAEAAEAPTVHAKISGLNTAADPATWSAEDLLPYLEHALSCFGPQRLMFGSDWPVAVLAGDYAQVWTETQRALADLGEPAREAVFGGTAIDFYRLAVADAR